MKNVKPGDRVKLTASDVNLWNKAAEAFRAGQFQSLETEYRESDNPVVITVQNKTGKFAGIFSVFALGESINLTGTDIDEAMPDGINKDVRFEGNTPDGDGVETICITLDASEKETLVSAVIIGAVGCAVDVLDSSHRYAVPVGGEVTKLQSSESGVIKILNPVTETGKQFCYVLLGGGGTSSEAAPGKVQLVQPKELFSACEYKSANEHYIICPGGRTAEGSSPYIFSFDLLTENWQATAFPTLQKAVYCADNVVTEVTFPATVEVPNPTPMKWMVISSGLDDEQEYNKLQIINLTSKERLDAFSTKIGSLLDTANFAGRPLIKLRDANTGIIIENAVHLIGGSASSLGTQDGRPGNYGQGIGGGYGSQTAAARLEFNLFLNLAQMVASVPNQMTVIQNSGSTPSWGFSKIVNMVDTLNTMARGFYRRYEINGKRVDYIQIGGRTRSTNSQPIVSFRLVPAGTSNNEYPIADSSNTNDFVHTYTPISIPLNECCVEHYIPNDTAIIVGGRTNNSGNATLPHYFGHVWNPSGNNNAGEFTENSIPRMPHPRWNAASVIIYNLTPLTPKRVYKDEYEFISIDGGGIKRSPIIDDTIQPDGNAADRMFIIGGRDENGLVPEVDVFNLQTFKWETDWKGLDEGELENIPPSISGGGGVTINITGGDGIQSVKAGNGIVITGTSKNPIVSMIGVYG